APARGGGGGVEGAPRAADRGRRPRDSQPAVRPEPGRAVRTLLAGAPGGCGDPDAERGRPSAFAVPAHAEPWRLASPVALRPRRSSGVPPSRLRLGSLPQREPALFGVGVV